MKIAGVVRAHIAGIIDYCETRDPEEFARLQDARYCKTELDINYPFFALRERLRQDLHVRYWRAEWPVLGRMVRVTSQWFNPPTSQSLPLLRAYLQKRGIALQMDIAAGQAAMQRLRVATLQPARDFPMRNARGRYRGTAIGVAQNALVRNILSRLGEDAFSEGDWQGVVAFFGDLCAYCGGGGKLVMDHAIPINREALGEHVLGNLVPACAKCNGEKGQQDFRSFLGEKAERIAAIEAQMARHGYRPIGQNAKLQAVIEQAHAELRQLADRYVQIIEATLPRDEM